MLGLKHLQNLWGARRKISEKHGAKKSRNATRAAMQHEDSSTSWRKLFLNIINIVAHDHFNQTQQTRVTRGNVYLNARRALQFCCKHNFPGLPCTGVFTLHGVWSYTDAESHSAYANLLHRSLSMMRGEVLHFIMSSSVTMLIYII